MGCTECSGCQAFDKCINKEIASKCKEPVCSLVPISAEFPNGYTCESPDAPERNCEDFICIANGIAPAYLVGAQKDAFLKLFECYDADCESIICTVDSCDENTGCVHDNLPCFVEEGSCNATLGCFEKNNIYGLEPGICQITTVWSLIDFCGRCRGDNIDCFFQTVVPAQTIAGITAGAVGGITVAAMKAVATVRSSGMDVADKVVSMKRDGNDNPLERVEMTVTIAESRPLSRRKRWVVTGGVLKAQTV